MYTYGYKPGSQRQKQIRTVFFCRVAVHATYEGKTIDRRYPGQETTLEWSLKTMTVDDVLLFFILLDRKELIFTEWIRMRRGELDRTKKNVTELDWTQINQYDIHILFP